MVIDGATPVAQLGLGQRLVDATRRCSHGPAAVQESAGEREKEKVNYNIIDKKVRLNSY